VSANTTGDWFRRSGGWLLLGLLSVVIITVAVAAALAPEHKSKKAVTEAKANLDATRAQVRADLDKHAAEMDARRLELDAIDDIDDEIERMRRKLEFEERLGR